MNAKPTPPNAANAPEKQRGPALGLSLKLLVLTVLFVMLAEVLIFVPSLANFRKNWLNDRVAAAELAAVALNVPMNEAAREAIMRADLLERLGALQLASRGPQGIRLLAARPAGAPEPDLDIMLEGQTALTLIHDAMETLTRGDRVLLIHGEADADGRSILLLTHEAPLRTVMLVYARNIGLLSVVISLITAGLVYLALNWLLVRPLLRLDGAMQRFAANPEDAGNILRPSARKDELGSAERQLSAMQAELRAMLGERRRLAELGLAVTKINHDLRNLLTSAQLLSDRLASVPDPTVQRLAPRMIHAIDRAVSFCEATLGYGRIGQEAPVRRAVNLSRLADDAADFAGLSPEGAPPFINAIPDDLTVSVDPDQMFRVFLNLMRNARQAIEQEEPGGEAHVTIAARPDGARLVLTLSDTGPGLVEGASARIFEPFHGTARKGGAGLGLAIAADLVRAHGGEIAYKPGVPRGAIFEIMLPLTTPPA